MINDLYRVSELAEYLKSKVDVINIALQFNHSNLCNATAIKEYLTKEVGSDPLRFYYFLGESSYGDCCVDEVTAQHLNPNLLIRVGNSCMTNPKSIKVYYLPEIKVLSEKVKEELMTVLSETMKEQKDSQTFAFYNLQYFYEIDPIIKKYNDSSDSKIYAPIHYNFHLRDSKTDFQLMNCKYLSIKDYIGKDDMILYLGEEQELGEEAYSYELVMRFSQKMKLSKISFNSNNLTCVKGSFDQVSINRIFNRRFNLSLKAKDASTFGIIVGNLNIGNINKILLEIKKLLHKNKKKFYTFLLGKVTDDKLSNYVEYIDCFILVACTCNSFVERKALMKPIICPIDLLHAFNEKPWDLVYSFDPSFFADESATSKDNKEKDYFEIQEVTSNVKSEALAVLDKDENKAMALIFGQNIISHYDDRNFKGLEIRKDEQQTLEIKKGKRGLPIKYEQLEQD